MSKLKITAICSLIALLIGCIVIDVWYFYIRQYGNEKVVSHTYEVGLQTTTDGNTKYFMEVNAFDNCYEVKFNYMLDENQTAFFSQGLQYYNSNSKVDFINTTKVVLAEYKENWAGWETSHYDHKNVITASFGGTNRLNYMSSDDYINTSISTNPIGDKTYFKIQLGEDLYLMKLKGEINISEYVRYNQGWWHSEYYRTSDVYDIDYLTGMLFKGISSLPYGANQAVIFEFGDLFNYYEYNESSGQYDRPVIPNKAELIEEDIKSYYSIKVTKHEGNITKASESIFNCVNGSMSFNLSNDYSSDDYFIGRTIIDTTLSHFDLVKVTDTDVALKLKTNFVNCYTQSKYKDKIYLTVLIDLDKLAEENLNFIGFTADSGLSNFTITSCQTVETVDGELVYSEVAYA